MKNVTQAFWIGFALSIGIFLSRGLIFAVSLATSFSLSSETRYIAQRTASVFDPFSTGVQDPSDAPIQQLQKMDITNLVDAPEYLVGDVDTGEILLHHNDTEVRPIASLTKLMTVLTSLQLLNQKKNVMVTLSDLWQYGSEGKLVIGQNISVGNLLFPLLLESSNDAAEAIAESAGRSRFIAAMNAKAKELGLINTHYVDSSGLRPGNVSTAADLFSLARYIYTNDKNIIDITDQKSHTIGKQTWVNNNWFINEPNYIGGKNGYTDEANHTLVALFKVPITGTLNQRTLAVIVLGSKKRADDGNTLLSFVEEQLRLLSQVNTATVSQAN